MVYCHVLFCVAHAKDALDLAKQQELTEQLKVQEKIKVQSKTEAFSIWLMICCHCHSIVRIILLGNLFFSKLFKNNEQEKPSLALSFCC